MIIAIKLKLLDMTTTGAYKNLSITISKVVKLQFVSWIFIFDVKLFLDVL